MCLCFQVRLKGDPKMIGYLRASKFHFQVNSFKFLPLPVFECWFRPARHFLLSPFFLRFLSSTLRRKSLNEQTECETEQVFIEKQNICAECTQIIVMIFTIDQHRSVVGVTSSCSNDRFVSGATWIVQIGEEFRSDFVPSFNDCSS